MAVGDTTLTAEGVETFLQVLTAAYLSRIAQLSRK
jgi:hypothetical protein